jgi:diguanylate cyclase (GGDEF)-like protein/PAS domain S-box-containing protein
MQKKTSSQQSNSCQESAPAPALPPRKSGTRGASFLRRVIADLPAMIWVAGPDGRTEFISPQWLDYTGMRAKQSIGDGWIDAVHPDDRAAAQHAWQAFVRAASPSKLEYRLRRHDGAYRWFVSQGTPAHDDQGQVTGWFGICTDIDDLKRAEEVLRENAEALRATFDQAGIGITHVGPDGRFLKVNRKFVDMIGYSEEELRRMCFIDITHPEDRSIGVSEYMRTIAGELPAFTIEKRYLRRDGSVMWVRITGTPVRGPQGKALYCVAVVEDINVRRQAELEREESERRLHLAVAIAQLGFWEWDLGSKECYYSPEFKRQLGYGEKELTPTVREWTSRLHPADRKRVFESVNAYLAAPHADFQIEYRVRHRDGSYRWMIANAIRIENPHGIHMTGTQLDVTERKEAEQRVLEAARHDPLTGLPNRALVFEYAGHLLAAAARNHSQGALLFIDLDRFKPINDLYGHEVGDHLLQEVGRRLTACVRKEDLIGRLGGDEFVIVMPHNGESAPATTVARHVLAALSRPFSIDTLDLSISASIGISHYPQHGTDIDTLIHAADLAMYQTKQAGRGDFHIFTAELSQRAGGASSIEARLKRALKGSGLVLHYQPVVNMHDGSVVGAEALLRLYGEDGRIIPPDRFVPVAESAGLIGPLGEWVALEACRQHEAWCRAGLPPVTIAINVSPLQFRQRGFAERLHGIVRASGLEPRFLQVEVTESTVMDNVDDAVQTLRHLRDGGIRIALDDFGTGYSSLSHLSNLPLDKLKVDQSFVQRLQHDRASRAITGAVIALGRTLNLEVVGEGIESTDALAYLQQHGCDQAQGFLISQPLAASDFSAWYRAPRSLRIWH